MAAGLTPFPPRAAGLHLHYGDEIQAELAQLTTAVTRQIPHDSPLAVYPPRWLALKLLEADVELTARVAQAPTGEVLLAEVRAAAARIEDVYGDTADIALADARYGFVHGVAHQVVRRTSTHRYDMTTRVDRIVAHRIFGLPLFFAVMYVMFKLVVDVSAPFLDWMDGVIHGPITRWADQLLTLAGAPNWLHALIADGIINGVGGVLVFLPGLFVLYLFLTFLEDSGYMARVAFLMDKVMSFTGLQGKSFIPLILGFGCAVPAIYATRTLENERDRIATGLLVPLMSCSARLPVYVVFGMAFFPRHADLLITGLYLSGIVIAAGVGWLFSRTLFRHSPQALRTAAPLVAGGGIDIGRLRGARHRHAAERLGRIHQQPRMARMVGQAPGHRFDRQHPAAVPEQVGEHHQPGAGAQGALQGLQGSHRHVAVIARQITHRQWGDRQPLATGQLATGRHHPRMLRIPQQDLLPLAPGQAPERQHAAAGDVLGEGHPRRRHPEPLGQPRAQRPTEAAQQRPDVLGEGAELLDALPGGDHRLKRRRGQGALAAVVEIGFGRQSGHLGPQSAHSTWPTATAATAENRVMPRAVRGFCPWATARVVITPAPRQATASWVGSSPREFGVGSTGQEGIWPDGREVGARRLRPGQGSLRVVVLR